METDLSIALDNDHAGISFTDEQVMRQLNTNLLGVILISKAFTPHFREKKNGMFINVTSTFGLLSYPTCSVYSASKFGVDGFSEGLAYELAQFNVSVKVIAPGGMQTDFAKRSLDGGSHRSYKALMGKVAEGYSADEVAKYTIPSDIAQVIFGAATDGKIKLRYVAGEDARTLFNERVNIGSEAQFRKIRSMFSSLWLI
ncbi:MAG: SDR family NAD(P)-dependent oxidoreductase [Sphingobacteriales bacterium]|nr:MAG: SDR family NAD(P)-dependent oxidoreductase [Sphingobacteriales bacterium]